MNITINITVENDDFYLSSGSEVQDTSNHILNITYLIRWFEYRSYPVAKPLLFHIPKVNVFPIQVG